MQPACCSGARNLASVSTKVACLQYGKTAAATLAFEFGERECVLKFFMRCIYSGRKGGELASAVHAYSKTGDPYMRSLVQHILGLVSHPILNFLYRWIYDGELEDTYHEVSCINGLFPLFRFG